LDPLKIDFNRKKLREKVFNEGLAAAQMRDPARVEAAIKEATTQWFLEIADCIRGYNAYWNNDFDGAIQYSQKAIRLDPALTVAHNLKIVSLMGAGKNEEAITSADYAIQHLLLIQFAVFYYNKGVALERLGQDDDALFCFWRTIEDDEAYEYGYQAIISQYSKREEWLSVLSVSALIRDKLNENSSFLNMTAGHLLTDAEIILKNGAKDISEKLVEEAGKLLELALRKEPENDHILYNLACFYSRSGKRSEATATLKKTLEIATRNGREMEVRQMARDDVDFTTIREDPLFKELVAKET
jgi:tetratricopeptide (TPR) repeat protein